MDALSAAPRLTAAYAVQRRSDQQPTPSEEPVSYLPSQPAEARLLDVFRTYPETSRPLLDYHEVLVRGRSDLTVAERELIAAYVSGLNECDYCHGVHAVTAVRFGVEEGLLTALLTDFDNAPVDDRLRTVLVYVAKLTKTPDRITPSDAEAVLSSGWSEKALHDAVSVCALFNLMNRLVSGLGITAGQDYFETSGDRLAEGGYAGLADLL
jgi:uncharacterized peroxidase-related enzyme